MGKLSEFIAYLEEQAANHSIYVWGGQGQDHTRISEAWIRERETSTDNANRAIAFWKKQVKAGYGERLRAFDCSGLATYYLYDVKKWIPGDTTANGLKGKCQVLSRSELTKGDWVFRVYQTGKDKGKAYHIGYIVDDSLNVIEAKGRDDGVVKRNLNASGSGYWNAYGRPELFREEIEGASPEDGMVEVLGGSVNVRAGDNTETAILGVAHKGDSFLLEGVSASGWYKIDYDGKDGYISSRSDLTRIAGDAPASFTVGRLLKKTSPLMTGEDVKDVQAALIAKGYSCGNTGADGEFGSNTQKAVEAFQKAAGLTADGIVGEKTTQALGGEWKAAGTTWSVSRILKKTSPLMKGADVKALQSALIAKGYSCGGTGADGEFGKNTESAVKSFQKAAGLTMDGKAGKNTVTKLGGVWLVPLG